MLTMFDVTSSFDVEANMLSARFALSPLEAKFLRILLAQHSAAKTDLPELSYSVRQVIYTLRKKLERISGVYIVNDGRGRYSIPRKSKQIIHHELRGDL